MLLLGSIHAASTLLASREPCPSGHFISGFSAIPYLTLPRLILFSRFSPLGDIVVTKYLVASSLSPRPCRTLPCAHTHAHTRCTHPTFCNPQPALGALLEFL